jgi:hypothetical protein
MAKVAISRRHWVTSTPQACAAHQDDAPLEETSHSSLPSVPTRSGRCYSRMAVPRPTRTQRLDTAIANLETWMQKQRTEPGIIRVICAKLLAGKDPPRRYKSELLRSSGGGSETGCDRMAILSGRPALCRLE